MVAVVSALIAAGFSYQAEQRQAHRADLQATVVELNEVRQATRLVGDGLASARGLPITKSLTCREGWLERSGASTSR
jgi:hypothetical protein